MRPAQHCFLGPRKLLFPHESAKKGFEGATSHTTCGSDPLVVSPQGLSLPEGWVTILVTILGHLAIVPRPPSLGTLGRASEAPL